MNNKKPISKIKLFIIVIISIIVSVTVNLFINNLNKIEKFEINELTEAYNCVNERFENDFKECTIKHLWYDERESELFIEVYMNYGNGSVNGVDESNVIVMLSDVEIKANTGEGSQYTNPTYSDWKWILIRESKTDPWIVDDWWL